MATNVNLQILISLAQQSKASMQATATGMQDILGEIKKLNAANLNNVSSQISGLHESSKTASEGIKGLDESVHKLTEGLKFLAGGFLGLESVKFLKELADNAARAEVLGTTLSVVGKNAGFTQAQLSGTDNAIQKLGITAQASRQSLVQFIQANLDLTKAATLARAAQDLAVVSGENSSDTYKRLILNIEQMDTVGLRYQGIVISRTDAENKYALAVGKTAKGLTAQEQQQAVFNAVLEKAKGLQGAYAAAMGDVGKQVTSLDRLFTQASTSIGQQLLPSYLAIVQQLSIFVEELTATSDAENAASDGGKKLGQSVGEVAASVRGVATFLVEHHKVITGIAEAYFGWKAFTSVVAAGEAILASAFVKSAVAAGGDALALIALAREEGVLATASYAAAGGVEALETALLGLVGGTVGVVVAGLSALVYAAHEFLQAEEALVPGSTWADVLHGKMTVLSSDFKEALRYFTSFSKFAQAAKEEFVTGGAGFSLEGGPDDKAGIAGAKNQRTADSAKGLDPKAKYFAALEEQQNINNALIIAQKTGTQQQLDAARAAYEAGKGKLDAAQTEFQTSIENKKTDITRKATDEREANERKQVIALQNIRIAAQDAQSKALGGGTVQNGGIINEGFGQQMGYLKAQLADLKAEGKDAAASAAGVGETIKRAAGEAKTPQELIEFKNNVKDVIAAVPQLAKSSGVAVAVAADNVMKAARQFTAALVAEARQRNKLLYDTGIEFVTTQNALAATQRTAQESSDKVALDSGLISLDTYYNNRADRIRKANEQEAQLSQARINQLTASLPTAVDANDRQSIKNEIQKEEDNRRIKAAQTETDLLEEQNAKAEQQRNIQSQIQDLIDQTDSVYGGLDSALDKINNKYDQMALKLKQVSGADDVIARRKEAEKFVATQQDINRELEQQDRYRRASLQYSRARADADVKSGRVTDLQAQANNNGFSRDEANNIAAQITAAQKNKSRLEDEQAKQKALDPSADVSGLTSQINTASTQVLELKTQMQDALNSITTVGQKFRLDFVDALANGLDELVTHSKNAQDAIKDIGVNFAKQVSQTYTRDIAQRVINKFDKGDGNGNGIFDSLAKTLGLERGQKNDGTSKNRASFVNVVNFHDTVAGGAKPGQTDSAGTLANPSSPFGAVGSAASSAASSLGFGDLANSVLGGLKTGGNLIKSLGALKTAGKTTNIAYEDDPFTGLISALGFAGGGQVFGPGSGTSDSIPAMLSDGEHVTNAAQTAKWLPLLTSINDGSLDRRVQSIAGGRSVLKYAAGGVVGAAGTVASEANMTQSGGSTSLQLMVHPDALHMTLNDWLQGEVSRMYANRP